MVKYNGVEINRLTFVAEAAIKLCGSPESWSPSEAINLADALWDELSMCVAKWNVDRTCVDSDD